jgi:hypothetical protein
VGERADRTVRRSEELEIRTPKRYPIRYVILYKNKRVVRLCVSPLTADPFSYISCLCVCFYQISSFEQLTLTKQVGRRRNFVIWKAKNVQQVLPQFVTRRNEREAENVGRPGIRPGYALQPEQDDARIRRGHSLSRNRIVGRTSAGIFFPRVEYNSPAISSVRFSQMTKNSTKTSV